MFCRAMSFAFTGHVSATGFRRKIKIFSISFCLLIGNSQGMYHWFFVLLGKEGKIYKIKFVLCINAPPNIKGHF